jgi:hypothetical protein
MREHLIKVKTLKSELGDKNHKKNFFKENILFGISSQI